MGKHNVDCRKEKIIEILKREKYTTMKLIAEECKVTTRTIRTDIAYLRNIYPQILIKRGKVNGGVYYRQD